MSGHEENKGIPFWWRAPVLCARRRVGVYYMLVLHNTLISIWENKWSAAGRNIQRVDYENTMVGNSLFVGKRCQERA
jgi:hypothetical protein